MHHDTPAYMGRLVAAVADTSDSTKYRDIVWAVRDALAPDTNEKRLVVYHARKRDHQEALSITAATLGE